MFEYILKMISDPSSRQQHSHPTPTCNLTHFHGFARIWVAGKIKSLNYDHLYGQFQELFRPWTRHFKRSHKLLQGLWPCEHICTSWLVTDWPVSHPGTVARLMAAQLGSGLTMAHIQKFWSPPSHTCMMILTLILYILCLYIMYFIFGAKLKGLFNWTLV